MRALALVLALVVSPAALAQVMSTCGPGKSCTVQRLIAANTARNAICVRGGAYPMVLGSSGTSNTIDFYTGCAPSDVLAVSGITFTPSSGLAQFGLAITSTQYISATSGLASGAASAGTAFASFPAAASTTGRLLFDSTNTVWRYSNGTNWPMVGPIQLADMISVYVPSSPTLLNVAAARFVAPRAVHALTALGSTVIRLEAATTLVAGVGAGNAVYSIHNATDGAVTSATVTVPCASAVGTVTTGSTDTTQALTAAEQFEVRLTSNGCATLPVVNITAGYTVVAPN